MGAIQFKQFSIFGGVEPLPVQKFYTQDDLASLPQGTKVHTKDGEYPIKSKLYIVQNGELTSIIDNRPDENQLAFFK